MRTEITETNTTEGLKVRPLDWEETRAILRPLFKGRAHWILVCHVRAYKLIQEIERRHYLGDKNFDFKLITAIWRGEEYLLIAAKKKHMRPYQLGSLLRQMIEGFKTSDREMERRDFLIPAPVKLIPDAYALAAWLFDGPVDLAMGA